jgi:hypothetical protein
VREGEGEREREREMMMMMIMITSNDNKTCLKQQKKEKRVFKKKYLNWN